MPPTLRIDPMSTANVTDATFEDEVIKSSTPVVVDFWAEWCAPCKAISPALEEIATELTGQVKIAKVNVDENPDTPGKYGVRGMPTFLVVKDGEVVAQHLGAMPKTQLEEWIKKNIA